MWASPLTHARTPTPHAPQEYLPIGGHRQFCEDSVKLAYGEDSGVVRGKQVAAIQSLSGTGSCRQACSHRSPPPTSLRHATTHGSRRVLQARPPRPAAARPAPSPMHHHTSAPRPCAPSPLRRAPSRLCRLFAEFQGHWMKGSKIYIPSPTW